MIKETRTFLEIVDSLRREGWTEDRPAAVFRSRNGRLVRVLWEDGSSAEAWVLSKEMVELMSKGDGAEV